MKKQAESDKKTLLMVFLSSFACFLCFFLFSHPVPAVNAQQQGREKAASLYREAVELANKGDEDRAIKLMMEAVQTDPGYSEAYTRLGYMLLKKGAPDKAIDAFMSALKSNPASHSSKTGLGLALLKKGNTRDAEAVLKESLKLNPSPSRAHFALGLLYEKKGEYEKAIKQFKEGIRKFKR